MTGNNMLKTCWWFLVFTFLSLLNILQSVEIECIPLMLCPLAVKLLTTRKQTPETFEFLNFSRCGSDDYNRPKIWCSKFKFCKTPDNLNGTCVHIKQCRSFISMINYVSPQDILIRNYLKKFRCNSEFDKEVHVCCSDQKTIQNRFLADSDNKLYESNVVGHKKRDIYGFYNDFHRNNLDFDPFSHHNHHHDDTFKRYHLYPEFSTRKHKENTGTSCTTPDNIKGVCKKTKECPQYLSLLKRLDKFKKSDIDYLNDFKCSNSEDESKVCCTENTETVVDETSTEENKKSSEEEIKKNSEDRPVVSTADRADKNPPSFNYQNCGKQPAISDKILGGTMTDLGEFPWLALFQYQSNRGLKYGCGGSLISSRHVLTAAHCLDMEILRRKGLTNLHKVVLGEYDTRNETDCIYSKYGDDCADPPQYLNVESIIKHELYNGTTTKNDIAIIKLDREVRFTDYIQPICLPPNQVDFIKGNETFTIAGWGKTETSEKMSPVKLKTKIPFASNQKCDSGSLPLSNGQICAGESKGKDTCNGDSGGPLMLDVNLNYEYSTHLVGIISYGLGKCGTTPSVFTYVPFYVDWIHRNIK